jgi:mRNA-degrading endonuclease YafQ of YafQ-DinJ toxin-antitoxin module
MKRRLPATVQTAVDDAVTRLMDNPLSGEPKRGALKGVRVEKFKAGNQQWLLAYQFNERSNVIEVLDVGTHENFYRDLEGYLRDR